MSLGGDNVSVMAAGLPNIIGSANINSTSGSASGAFYYTNRANGAGGDNYSQYNLQFNASRSSSIYGASSTVQPPAICLIPQIKY